MTLPDKGSITNPSDFPISKQGDNQLSQLRIDAIPIRPGSLVKAIAGAEYIVIIGNTPGKRTRR